MATFLQVVWQPDRVDSRVGFDSRVHGPSASPDPGLAVEDYPPAVWRPRMLFLPDNAPIHTARMVQNWFGEQGMPLMDWPPDSPDFAPIEHGMIEICPPWVGCCAD